MTYAPPTTEEELDRKALTELERILHGYETRTISLESAAGAANSIWGTMAGLISRETMDLVAQACNKLNGHLKKSGAADEVAFLLGGPGGAYVVRRDGRTVYVFSWVGSSTNTERSAQAPESEVHPEKWASEKFEEIVNAINIKGFKLAYKASVTNE